MLNLPQGTTVTFKISPTVYGTGKVCGVAQESQPFIGRTLIIELTESHGFDKTSYPYSHIVITESLLTQIGA